MMKNNDANYIEEDLALKLLIVLSRANRSVMERVQEDIKSYGLNTTEFAVLELIYHKGEQPIQQIGKKVLLSSGSITYVVDKLEEKHLLERKPCPNDRRITYTKITKQGQELMDEIFPKHRQAIKTIFEGISTEEKEDLLNLLKKIGFYAENL